MFKYGKRHVGEVYTNSDGYPITIVGCGSKPKYVTIQIGDYTKEALFVHVKKGSIRNPCHPTKYGVGYLGDGGYNSLLDPKAYDLWVRMLQRAYDPKYHSVQPTYVDVAVCKEWHNFQVFAEWFYEESNYVDGWHLDKDLVEPKAKLYSPRTCVFVPRSLNNFLSNIYSTNTSGHVGVLPHGSKWIAKLSNDYLGTTDTFDEAVALYKDAREVKVIEWKVKMVNSLPATAIKQIK